MMYSTSTMQIDIVVGSSRSRTCCKYQIICVWATSENQSLASGENL